MNEVSLLRQIRSDAPEPDREAVDQARAALFERIHADAIPGVRSLPAKRHRRARWAGLGVLGAGALTVALVATNLLGVGDWRGGAEPAAANALNQAALASIDTSDPALLPGQYLLVESSSVYGNTTQVDNGEYVSYLTLNKDKLYVPADQSDEWIWERGARVPYQFFNAEGEELAQREYVAGGQTDETLRAPNAEFYGNSVVPNFEALPKDPQQLLDYIYKTTEGQGVSADWMALLWITEALRTGVAPAEVRANLYLAVAGIPGVEITERTANLDGQTGIAIGRYESKDDSRQDIIIDPDTGTLIGERRIDYSGDWGYPAGTVQSFTAITTSVVDSAPDGGTQNGQLDREGCTDLGNGAFQC